MDWSKIVCDGQELGTIDCDKNSLTIKWTDDAKAMCKEDCCN